MRNCTNLALTCALAALFLSPRASGADCTALPGVATLVSPRSIVAGHPVHILLARDAPFAVTSVTFNNGHVSTALAPGDSGGGPPYWVTLSLTPDAVGPATVVIATDQGHHCVSLQARAKPRPRPRRSGTWPAPQKWSRAHENLYSAWLDHLFAVPEGTAWPALHEVTRDPERNLLYNHLGLNEDAPDRRRPLRLNPDCADNPYFLRAYFAWKTGLPFGFHQCDRGRKGRPPQCQGFSSNLDGRRGKDEVRDFYLFTRKLKSAIHSGSARTAIDATAGDLYPVALTPAALRPGTVFADPYGHTLMLVRRVPQTAATPGLLMAVDAQPDGTVTVKRFWRGNFLFETQAVVGGPGFKAFRPVAISNGGAHPMSNKALARSPWVAPYSLVQASLSSVAFYDAMARVVNPLPVAPEQAYRQLHDALFEQVLTRVTAIDNGEAWHRDHPGTTMAMPSGIALFQTSGPWEDFSTPSRDLRLLIALDSVRDFPDQVQRMPEAFIIPSGQSPAETRALLLARHEAWSAEATFTYTRSDGTAQTLSLADLFARHQALEVGYNPNDCPERRWGAPPESEEATSCRRRAPKAQQRKMQSNRGWFINRRRPAWD